jgi:hypothetical protein
MDRESQLPKMDCLYCRRKIGYLRRVTDAEYCCPDHRVKMRALSARALRDQANDTGDYDDVSTVFVKPIDGLSSKGAGANPGSTAVFTVLMVIALVVGTTGLPESSRQVSTSVAKTGTFDSFRTKLRGYAAVRVTDDFKRGLSSWSPTNSTTQARDWSYRDGFVRPGRLRLLKASMPMTDYSVEFMGEVEQKAISWAYRAKDARNYYAGKIVVSKRGPLPRAELVRYAVIGGAEQARVSIPLPVIARADALYKVQMTVRANDFSATVNGMMVDTWSDPRLTAGGVGFFAEAGEVATLRYVTISDKDTIVGRVLSYLGFLLPMLPTL